MGNPLKLIWHQFRKETREHLWFILGTGLIAGVLTVLGATSLLEDATNSWGRPLLMDNEELYFMITLLPAALMVPFVVLADSGYDAEAFWLTKPTSATGVVGGKLMWLTVWLIGLPLLGEAIVLTSLGGGSKLAYTSFDYVLFRGAVLFTIFGLATLAGHWLHLTAIVIGIPFSMEMLAAIAATFIGPNTDIKSPWTYAAEVLWGTYWMAALIAAAIAVAWVQYRWRHHRIAGISAALGSFVLVFAVAHHSPALVARPFVAADPMTTAFRKAELTLTPARIVPGSLTVDCSGRPMLRTSAQVTGLPALGAVGLARLSLTVKANGREISFEHLSNDWNRFFEAGATKKRIFANLIRQQQGKTLPQSAEVRATMKIPLPLDANSTLLNAGPVTISGTAAFDCFTYEEFGRLQPAPYDGRTSPPNNIRVRSTMVRDGTRLTMVWPVATGSLRHVTMINRHIAATHDPGNAEPWTKSHTEIEPWFYLLRDTRSSAYWEEYEEQANEHCNAAARCAIHINQGWIRLPESFPANEAIAFRARYLGTVQRAFTINEISLTETE
jgi:hypothetical protein